MKTLLINLVNGKEPYEAIKLDGVLYPIARVESRIFVRNLGEFLDSWDESAIIKLERASTDSWADVKAYDEKYGHYCTYHSLTNMDFLNVFQPDDAGSEFWSAISVDYDYDEFVDKVNKLNSLSSIQFKPVFTKAKEKTELGSIREPIQPSIFVHQILFVNDYKKKLEEQGADEWKIRDLAKKYSKKKLSEMIVEACGIDGLEIINSLPTVDSLLL